MSATFRFVIDALRPSAMASPCARPVFLADEASWEEIFSFANAIHATLPFAKSVRSAEWFEELSSGIRGRVEKLLQLERMRLALHDQELQFADQVLEGADIPFIVVKGMDVGRRFYPDRLFRPMGDIDLLVSEADFERAGAALEAYGYQCVGQYAKAAFRKDYSRGSGFSTLDLHKRLLVDDKPRLTAQFWERAVSVPFKDLDREYLVLSPEDCLAYVIRHGAFQHLLESPVWLNDAHFIVESCPELDWNRTLSILYETRAASVTWLVLTMLAQDWGTPVPQEVLDAVRGRVGWLRRKSLSRIGRAVPWFLTGSRTLPLLIASRYLLRDNLFEVVRYGLRRFTRGHKGPIANES